MLLHPGALTDPETSLISPQAWETIRETLLINRYVVLSHFLPDPHFVGAVLDRYPDNGPPVFHYLDSLQGEGKGLEQLLQITRQLIAAVSRIQHNPCNSDDWVIVTTDTQHMIKQRPYRPPPCHTSSTHRLWYLRPANGPMSTQANTAPANNTRHCYAVQGPRSG